MSQAKMGAVVRYCGHDASFVADVHRIGNVNLIIAAAKEGKFEKSLTRPCSPDATHHMDDFSPSLYWNPRRGVFCIPEKNCKELKK